jgi:hypothetical protein
MVDSPGNPTAGPLVKEIVLTTHKAGNLRGVVQPLQGRGRRHKEQTR